MWKRWWKLYFSTTEFRGNGPDRQDLGCSDSSEMRDSPVISSCTCCHERGIACDNQYPQCSQCFQEQLLCFYIGTSGKKRLSSRRMPVQTLDE
ncbi:hypothetical protein PABG_04497 [Paracoccidioides brasiliensis Pb03]|uniref:Zn(2)-C6 fungal-type domain-containing protein n=2 Tax=Paracoccidioides brasiliensis TaxID=121759 RepID=C1GB88_PARBD|nr:uncharacterized protein PADG_04889 [Paracoccidioides brasiliensis Pb18]EEH22286.1 hypothetical protein PABG_04497 [Paracoccidioides brasiliensis Pb03]EEH48810.2 hypothetical protein PADG_04889 [Paracoccidioides brasiliensis Pb18]ODH39511.1 hypothetical protein ACO22_01848 [Paracoccidioides brasiliensis]ODH51352.1 hypothetical protein GX48_02408 [Paracoccidioides brasiliensis]